MELDDLKQAWQDQKLDVSEAPDVQNIMNMLQNKNYGPIWYLRKKLKQSIILTIICWIFVCTCFVSVRSEFLYLSLIFITIINMISFLFDYRVLKILSEIVKINYSIKSEIQIKLSKIPMLWKSQIFTRLIFLAFYLIILELYHHYASNRIMIDRLFLFDFNFIYRLVIYAIIFIFVILIGKNAYKREYGKYIDHIKKLIDQFQ